MQAIKKRHIAKGKQYDHFIPKPLWKTEVIHPVASVWDTIEFMPQASIKSLGDTKKLAKKLQENDLYQTCENIWNFVYHHIQYKPDRFGVEQVRSAARLWAERKKGGDCDCYSVFISSILTNLEIPHTFRITQYPKPNGEKPNWQHVYIIVPNGEKYITIDCVTDQFDYEVPYHKKTDKIMELHYLNGFDIDPDLYPDHDIDITGIDATDLLEGSDNLGLLRIGKKHKATRQANRQKRKEKREERGGSRLKVGLKKVGKVAGKGLHIINRVNPAAGLLRIGLLASMKLNLMGVAKILRYAYLSPTRAKQMGVDMAKFPKLQKIRLRAEQIFHKAGGKSVNLKNAILKGKGNSDKKVPLSGLGNLDMLEYHQNSPLSLILGEEIYQDEIPTSELNGLGEVATGTAIAAASAAIGALATLLKALGPLLKKTPQAPDSNPHPEKPLDEDQFIPEDFDGEHFQLPEINFDDLTNDLNKKAAPNHAMMQRTTTTQESPVFMDSSDSETVEEEPEKEGFAKIWEEHKTKVYWTGGILAAAGIAYGIYKWSEANKKEKEAKKKKTSQQGVGKLPPSKRKRKTRTKTRARTKPQKKRTTRAKGKTKANPKPKLALL